nr:MAG TPA: hypothetical protein [Caudoviricetes sp.]
MNEKYGVIQEQGFVTPGCDLGFKPLTEDERKNIEKSFADKDKK